ncbi:hypothetical protein ZIOFF_071469 [Zingiber officinale]|uniref:Uncharacterized protein n=1 Tax=Zingiber officinale TaxID=94328 RepID=A0A8J5ENP0_ZINOF|nr:hypothetical protein ZIOFF_071469 [Zingiber officinale]
MIPRTCWSMHAVSKFYHIILYLVSKYGTHQYFTSDYSDMEVTNSFKYGISLWSRDMVSASATAGVCHIPVWRTTARKVRDHTPCMDIFLLGIFFLPSLLWSFSHPFQIYIGPTGLRTGHVPFDYFVGKVSSSFI